MYTKLVSIRKCMGASISVAFSNNGRAINANLRYTPILSVYCNLQLRAPANSLGFLTSDIKSRKIREAYNQGIHNTVKQLTGELRTSSFKNFKNLIQ